jgi:hypothetical protein
MYVGLSKNCSEWWWGLNQAHIPQSKKGTVAITTRSRETAVAIADANVIEKIGHNGTKNTGITMPRSQFSSR